MKALLTSLLIITSVVVFSQDKYALWDDGEMPYCQENDQGI